MSGRRIFLGAFSILLGAASASAQSDTFSANQVVRGCRVVASKATPGELLMLSGVCFGMVRALANLPDRLFGYCVPRGVTTEQAMRVAVTYVDRNPHRSHEQFDALVVQAFQAAWPCR